MPGRTRKKQAGKKRPTQDRKAANQGREVSKALHDLTLIFTRAELSRRFHVRPGDITRYRVYHGPKPFDYATRRRILGYYKTLQQRKRGQDFRYSYHVVGKYRRLRPAFWVSTQEVNDLIKEVGIKKASKQLGVTTRTIQRWKNGEFKRLKPRHQRKLYKVHKKKFPEKLDGVFYLISPEDEKFERGKGRRYHHYAFIAFYKNNEGDEKGFLRYVQNDNYYKADDYIIEEPKHFSEKEASTFIEHMEGVQKTHNEKLIRMSIDALREFVDTEFESKVEKKVRVEVRTRVWRRVRVKGKGKKAVYRKRRAWAKKNVYRKKMVTGAAWARLRAKIKKYS